MTGFNFGEIGFGDSGENSFLAFQVPLATTCDGFVAGSLVGVFFFT